MKIAVEIAYHKTQAEAFGGAARYKIVCAGRRWGKTLGGIFWLTERALDTRKSLNWWVSPVFAQAKHAFEIFREKFIDLIKYKNETDLRVDLYGGARIDFRSADRPEFLRGHGIDSLVMDECATMKRHTWDEILRPSIIDRRGHVVFIGTPKGDNHFHELYIRGQDAKEPEYQSFQFSSYDNPFLDRKELESTRAEMPSRLFDQEIMAQFTENIGGVFRGVRECVRGDYEAPVDGKGYVMGVDLGRYEDFTVIVVARKDTMQVVAFDRFKDINWSLQEQRILNLAGLYKPRVLIDQGQVGDAVLESLRRRYPAIEGIKFTNENKAAMINNLSNLIEKQMIFFPDIPEMINELRIYEYEMTASGNLRMNAPSGRHDDCLKRGTLIKTIEGYKEVENIKCGDLVLTHTGKFQKVVNCIEKQFSNYFYNFKFNSQLGIGLSYNHPLFAACNNYEGKKIIDRNKRCWILPCEWKKAYKQISIIENIDYENKNIELKENNFYDNGIMAHTKLKSIVLDTAFAKFLGFFLAEGNCSDAGRYTMTIPFNYKQDDIQVKEEIEEYIKNLGISTHYDKGNGCSVLVFSSKFLHAIMSLCYDENGEKQLPYFYRDLGRDLELTLNYWIKGDGWKLKNRKTYDAIVATTSKKLALNMRDICWSLNKYAVIHKLKRYRYGIRNKDQYWVSIRNERKQNDKLDCFSEIEYGSHCHKIKKEWFEGTVYNLQVENDESFIAEGIVVHNCVIALALAAWKLVSRSGVGVRFVER